MSNFNFDENTVSKLKDMMNKGELSDVISQIPPEMIQNFSSMMNQNPNSQGGNTSGVQYNQTSQANYNQNSSNFQTNSTNTINNNGGFDFNNIDMNMVMKMTSAMNKMNNSNDPKNNLLQSLKPYLRESRRGKVDQYSNLLNVAKMAEFLKPDMMNPNKNKESPNDGK